MVRKVLVLAEKLHHAIYVVRPGRCFVRRLLQMSGVHLNGEGLTRRDRACERTRKKTGVERILGLEPEFVADVA